MKHAQITGNASSQAYVAFFYATGYQEIVPVDQAIAQLYYTFSAQGGDKGGQMALAYRYWSGIGTLEDCNLAMEWYEAASEQSMCIAISPNDAVELTSFCQRWLSSSRDHQAVAHYRKSLYDCLISREVYTGQVQVSHRRAST